MLIREEIGGNLVRHYSDKGMRLKQNETGREYVEAIDVLPCRYTYTETETPISGEAGAEE